MAQNFLAAFRWKVALDIGNDKYQKAQQNSYLEHVIDKKLNAAAKRFAEVYGHERCLHDHVFNFDLDMASWANRSPLFCFALSGQRPKPLDAKDLPALWPGDLFQGSSTVTSRTHLEVVLKGDMGY